MLEDGHASKNSKNVLKHQTIRSVLQSGGSRKNKQQDINKNHNNSNSNSNNNTDNNTNKTGMLLGVISKRRLLERLRQDTTKNLGADLMRLLSKSMHGAGGSNRNHAEGGAGAGAGTGSGGDNNGGVDNNSGASGGGSGGGISSGSGDVVGGNSSGTLDHDHDRSRSHSQGRGLGLGPGLGQGERVGSASPPALVVTTIYAAKNDVPVLPLPPSPLPPPSHLTSLGHSL